MKNVYASLFSLINQFDVGPLVHQINMSHKKTHGMTSELRLTNHPVDFSFINTENHTGPSTDLTFQITYHFRVILKILLVIKV